MSCSFLPNNAPPNRTLHELIAALWRLPSKRGKPVAVTFLPPSEQKNGLMDRCHENTRSPHRGATKLIKGTTVGKRGVEMVSYTMRHRPRECPSEDQRKFLETLRDLGPRDNAQTAAIRKSTKRACQVRGWVEWRCLDGLPGIRAWHLTTMGRKALKSPGRRNRAISVRLANRNRLSPQVSSFS